MEHVIKCNTCGKVFTYTDKDMKSSAVTGLLAGLSGIGAALGGSSVDMVVANQNLDRAERERIDPNRCPYCNSTNVKELTESEIKALQSSGENAAPEKPITVDINPNATNEALLKRAKLFLEDHEWATASVYCDRVLDVDPEDAHAYLYKLLAENKVSSIEGLKASGNVFIDSLNYQKYLRFGDANEILKTKEIAENNLLQCKYDEAMQMKKADDAELIEKAKSLFDELGDYSDASVQANECQEIMDALAREKEERLRKEAEELAAKKEQQAVAKEKLLKKLKVIIPCSVVVIVALAVFFGIIQPRIEMGKRYDEAVKALEEEQYDRAIDLFKTTEGYKDTKSHLEKAEKKAQDKATYDDVKDAYKMSLSVAIQKFESVPDLLTDKDKKDLSTWKRLLKCAGTYNGTYREYVGTKYERKKYDHSDHILTLDFVVTDGKAYNVSEFSDEPLLIEHDGSDYDFKAYISNNESLRFSEKKAVYKWNDVENHFEK